MANEIVAGGNGVDGKLKILGADGKPLLETVVGDRPIPAKSSEVRIGTTDRIGVISMHDATDTRTIRIDAAPASINLGKPGKNMISMNSRQIIISGEDGREQFIADAGSKGSRVDIGIAPLPGRLRLHGKEVSVTGAPVELSGEDASLLLGRSGTNGSVTLFGSDAKPRMSIGSDAAIRAGGNGASGFVSMMSTDNRQRIALDAQAASVRVGGKGANGTVSVLGADDEALVQIAAQLNQALIRLGRADRPARISMTGPNGEMVRLDGKTGDIALLNADCAEMFDVDGDAAPGTVMVMTDEGSLAKSEKPYDTRVAGVVSGAGSYKPGLVLDHRETGQERAPIALMGKVYCLVDATAEPVRVGDLLTTSETAGHAMAISDRSRAFGAVLGKALAPLTSGRGLIPILVALQ